MPLPTAAPRARPTTLSRTQRLIRRWWTQQSPTRQDRYATIGPLVSVLLFLAAIVAAFWYLRQEEIARETQSVRRDTELAQQQVRLRLLENQDSLQRLARDLTLRSYTPEQFQARALALSTERPEIVQMYWVSGQRQLRAAWAANAFHVEANPSGEAIAPVLPGGGADGESERAFAAARSQRLAVYTRAFNDITGTPVFQVHVPLFERSSFDGVLLAEVGIETLIRQVVPAEITQRHPIAVHDDTGRAVVSTISAAVEGSMPSIHHDVPMTPAHNGLVLRGQGWRTSVGLIGNTLFWMVMALSALTVWMLLGTFRHVQRRSQMQAALIQETNFRRAMENSMLTGMRATDLDGRITYVNPAFCAMTGFTEAELLNRMPPFPHWPPDRIDENMRLLQQELQGRSPAGGIEVKVMRRDGTVFDARMYVSPLVDTRGVQTGWVTSMTNITEAKRIRDQLSASHERFTTVLEGLDAAVSVLSVQQGELLFANRSYRLWFGADPKGHARLSGHPLAGAVPRDGEDAVDAFGGLPASELTDTGAMPKEVFVESLKKWFDVRSRYLQWTDGRLAQMLIATDITARRRAEELAARQAEKAQVTARLVTMGEMASSVAHELNQPLTAITNYCNGMVSRVRSGGIGQDDLVAALEKTARQAQRAGQIIHRIRSFVKRSEPQRQPSRVQPIVDNVIELASIELRRRQVQIHTYVAQRLPVLMVDPILIEQVLLNLLKNAAEAIDSADLPPSRRQIELRVVPRHTPEEGGVIEFSVTDRGPGMKEEVLARIYEAFFSTKSDGLGIGLGLCRSIVESHRGRLRAQNLYNGELIAGCRFAFTLPVELSPRGDAGPGSLPPNESSSVTP